MRHCSILRFKRVNFPFPSSTSLSLVNFSLISILAPSTEYDSIIVTIRLEFLRYETRNEGAAPKFSFSFAMESSRIKVKSQRYTHISTVIA